jgi:hypothetical protein
MDYILSNHAIEKIRKRNISIDLIDKVFQNPQQIIKESEMSIFQSILIVDNKEYLLRLFVNIKKIPSVLVTVYITSNISKYWISNEN